MSRIVGTQRNRIRQRAFQRCEYCRRPDVTMKISYHVDHIVPARHGGGEGDHNLSWACYHCNGSKAGDIASYDMETGELTPLFHPRRHQWADHFVVVDGMIVGVTAIGRVTVRLLQFNSADQVRARLNLIRIGLWD